MKKLILAITVATLSIGAFAGEACCAKEKAAKVAKSVSGNTCTATAKSACATTANATAGCSLSKAKCSHLTVKKVQSPKAAAQS